MRDYRGNVETRLEHRCHEVPGLVHLTTIDALDGDTVEDHLAPIDAVRLRRNTEHGHLAPMTEVTQHVLKSHRVSRHFEANVEALFHAQLLLNFFQRTCTRISGQSRTHPPCELKSFGIEVGDHDMARTCVSRYRGSHDADGPSASDQHILAKQGKGKRRMNRIPKRIKDRCDLGGNVGAVPPNIADRNRNVLRERAMPVDAHALRVGAEMPTPC